MSTSEADGPWRATARPQTIRYLPRLIAGGGVCLLFLVVAIPYLSLANAGFVVLDDEQYVSGNRHLLHGLSIRGVQWALTATLNSNWHPVTWLSHLADVAVFGLNPAGHHAVSVLIHLLNTGLMFFLMRRLTGRVFAAWFAAAWFGVHPLHVESVAWISERKDLLCGLFSILCLLFYAGVGRGRSAWVCRLGTSVSCALALMAKPMAVTLPLVLLLLDYWPLGRLARNATAAAPRSEQAGVRPDTPALRWWRLIAGKADLFAMSFVSIGITMRVQAGSALVDAAHLPWFDRVQHAVLAYGFYLCKLFVPIWLAPFYPYDRGSESWSLVVVCVVVMVAITVAVWAGRGTRPWWLFGWLWFLGMLVPVIGLVQVGEQAWADRYMYLPATGIMLPLALECDALRARSVRWARGVWLLAAAVTLVLAVLCGRQAARWQSSETLFRHTLAVTGANHTAEYCLGLALQRSGRADDAVPHLQAAIRLNPSSARAYNVLGVIHAERGQLWEAAVWLAQARALPDADSDVFHNYGNVLLQLRRPAEAEAEYRRAHAFSPDQPDILVGLGLAAAMQGRLADAVAWWQRCLAVAPGHPDAVRNLEKAAMLQRGAP